MRDVLVDRSATNAEGVAQTDGESMRPGDRDADGRQPWRFPVRPVKSEGAHQPTPGTSAADPADPPPQIDLCG
jgi:hypothetical protein